MKLLLRIDVTDEMRRWVAHHCGRPGLASRGEVERSLNALVTAYFEDLQADYRQASDETGA
jgi:hypothetical protein